MVTGATIGAGMLALPTVTAPAGLCPSLAVLGGAWLMLSLTALAIAEVNLALREKRAQDIVAGPSTDHIVSISEMAAETLGSSGAFCVTLVYCVLEITLLVAYINKAGSVLENATGAPAWASAAAFTGVLGTLVAAGGTEATERVNRLMTAALLLAFGGIIFELSTNGNAHWDAALSVADWSAAPAALPIVLLSLVYHDLIPVLVAYLGGDRGRIRTCLVAGSLIPLAMFASWDAVALASVPGAPSGAVVDPLAALAAGGAGAAWLGPVLTMFSLLAIATSFSCTALSTVEYVAAELARLLARGARDDDGGATPPPPPERIRPWAFLLGLGPPCLIAASPNPDIFLAAANVAGGVFDTALYGILPPLMAYGLRHSPETPDAVAPMVPGGRAALGGVFGAFLCVGLYQAMESASEVVPAAAGQAEAVPMLAAAEGTSRVAEIGSQLVSIIGGLQ
ncbi:unnamed protein product [Pedinophyceae sp. YPF-701]|nr:unnamed protein product [Pedinophyceae sp. YPF-701]